MDGMRSLTDGFPAGFSASEAPLSADYGAMSRLADDGDVADNQGIESPIGIGTDERRMHVRAYNFWAQMLGHRLFPSIEDLDLESLGDFGPNSVLLDFTSGLENPSITYLGEALRKECDLPRDLGYIDQVPSRSLLSRLTDHYLQIIANRAPVGFEAEFVNERGLPIMYRGILMPFSSDDDTIDFIMGVINWKQVAEAELVDQLQQEVAAAFDAATPAHRAPTNIWADGPAHGSDLLAQQGELDEPFPEARFGIQRNLIDLGHEPLILSSSDQLPGFDAADHAQAAPSTAPLQAHMPDASDSLYDWLANAREMAVRAGEADGRSRDALYQAIGRAWSFALIAREQPDDYAEMLEDAGIIAAPRAPMTPIVKLVFGVDHDKTRLAEYAAVLTYAEREQIAGDALANHIARYSGGLKALVRDVRKTKRGGNSAPLQDRKLETNMRHLRHLPALATVDVDIGAEEFVVFIARRGDMPATVDIVDVITDPAQRDRILRQLPH